jgi:exopolyphosphatase/guanosine-5'-triphosphate,3'-diphosphate pyrophosphatase
LQAAITDALSRASVKRFVPPPLLVGVAGTVTTLAALSLEMDEYEAERVHGHVLSRAEVTRIENALFALSLSQRKSLAGMPAKRADVLPAGAMLLRSVMDHLGADEVLVSDRGIRWGRLFERFGV